MQKRKSTRETKNMVQTALWLPREMHEALKKAGGERGLGEEIRRRLQMTFAEDSLAMPGDGVTEEVLDQIEDIARDLSRDEPWYTDAFKVDVLNAAVTTLLLSRRLSSVDRLSNVEKPEIRARLTDKYGEEKPDAIGRLLAHATMIAYSREGAGRGFPRRPRR
jgi:hypothetical protein